VVQYAEAFLNAFGGLLRADRTEHGARWAHADKARTAEYEAGPYAGDL
jgi:hypothetical protein